MLSRGHTSVMPGPELAFGVPVEMAAPGPYVPDQPTDFPPGTPGSRLPFPVPERIQAVLDAIGEGHTFAWQPVLRRVVLWKPRRREFSASEELNSIRSQLLLAGFSRHEIALVVDPLIRASQSGWTCCFVLQNSYGFPWAGIMPNESVPIDNRFLAMLYDSSPESYGGVLAMRNAVRDQHNKDVQDTEKRKRERFQEQFDAARTLTRISNIAPGNRSMLQNRPDLAARQMKDLPDI